jgi:hypothetical protein
MITKEKAGKLFRYDGERLFWVSSGRGRNIDLSITSISRGYLVVCVDGKSYHVHRIIFLICFGYLPELVDHIDGDRLNNKIENLRACTYTGNNRNRRICRRNKTGVKGVSWHKVGQKWQVRICTDKGRKHLGLFDNLGDAEKVAKNAREKYHGEFCNHG